MSYSSEVCEHDGEDEVDDVMPEDSEVDEAVDGPQSMVTVEGADNVILKKHALLSIDIGVHNLGFAVFYSPDMKQLNEHSFKDIQLTFGIYDTEAHIPKRSDSIVTGRAYSVKKFLDIIQKQFIIDAIVVERQINSNTKAMELMGAFIGCAVHYTNRLKIFDPKLKFTKIHETYVTAGKQHKKQSIMYAERVLWTFYRGHLTDFYACSKRDDYSDAINQGIVYGIDVGLFRGFSLMDYRKVVIDDGNDEKLRFGATSKQVRGGKGRK